MLRLIPTAADFGLYRCVSAGILECIDAGSVLAAGVVPNADAFDHLVGELKARPWVDVGVQLNLGTGRPLTELVARRLPLPVPGGVDRRRILLAAALGTLPLSAIEAEWRAQVEHARAAGLPLAFLNAPPALLLLPSIRRLVFALAGDYGVPWVRIPGGEAAGRSRAAWLASLAARLQMGLAMSAPGVAGLPCVGTSVTDGLDGCTLRRLVSALPRDRVFELVCHPGRVDMGEVGDPRVFTRHRWEEERRLLGGPDFRELCAALGVETTRYRDLSASLGQLPAVQA